MKKVTKNRGLFLASTAIAIVLLVSFSVGNVFAGTFVESPVVLAKMHNDLQAFELVQFFEQDRPTTPGETIIWAAATVPGHKPDVQARCNSPS
jgi:hypothetical protein